MDFGMKLEDLTLAVAYSHANGGLKTQYATEEEDRIVTELNNRSRNYNLPQ